MGINKWGTDGLMNLRQKWRLIIYVVKGGGGGFQETCNTHQ